MHKEIRIVERDGFLRRGFPCTVAVAFEAGEFGEGEPARVLDAEGGERPVQVDVVEVWEDGSVRTAEVSFPAPLPARGEGVFRFEYGAETPQPAPQRNSLEVREEGEPIEVQQGPVVYRVRRDGFNFVDRVVFDQKRFLRPGARGPVLVLKDGQELLPEGTAEVGVETRGPRSARLRVTGVYEGGYEFATRLTFYCGVSWFRADHEVLSGDTAQVASILVESDFDLPEAPLFSAFGARERADGAATSWAVVTDGVSTVDAAAVGAWSETGSVRYEAEPDGRFRAIFPFEGQACTVYYHYLITPPMDHHHTPAAAMVADPVCRVV